MPEGRGGVSTNDRTSALIFLVALPHSRSRDTAMPRIARILWRSIVSRGDRLGLSSHRLKSAIFTSCSTRTSAPDTFTTPVPWGNPSTHSFPRIAAIPWATASKSEEAVTSTVCRVAVTQSIQAKGEQGRREVRQKIQSGENQNVPQKNNEAQVAQLP